MNACLYIQFLSKSMHFVSIYFFKDVNCPLSCRVARLQNLALKYCTECSNSSFLVFQANSILLTGLPYSQCLAARNRDVSLGHSIVTVFLPICPCSYFQALLDRRFFPSLIQLSLRRICFSNVFQPQDVLCCYDFGL